MPSLHATKKQIPKPPTILRWLRLSFRLQTMISTRWAARRAYRFWFMSPRYNTPPREQQWLDHAEKIQMPHPHGPIALYQWGAGEQTILLLHGWSGRGSQMGAFARPLVEAGYRVIAIDAPGHGQSPGKSTTVFKISEVLAAVANNYGPIKAVIGHSFGAFVLAYTLKHSDMKIDRAVCISTPARAEFLLDSFCDTLQLNTHVRQKFLDYFKRDFGDDIWHRMDIEKNVADLQQPCLIVHDRDDYDVPCELSEKLARTWPGAELFLTSNLGHRRVLRNRKIIQRVVEFIKRPASTPPMTADQDTSPMCC